ncbi:MAG: YfiH family protein [Polaribacter sp.]|jgi:YfiH family protein
MDVNEYLIPDWPAPDWIKSAVTTRKGKNKSQFGSFNIADHVNDDLNNVTKNRAQLIKDLELKNSPQWIEQIHGIKSTELLSASEMLTVDPQTNKAVCADASYTKQLDLPCVVMTADCLPVLLTNKSGTWVCAIHAGWRGLCDGIIESTVAKYEGASNELIAWLGPAISQKYFEVGHEVREKFLAVDKKYVDAFKVHKPNHYMADLYFIARNKLSCLSIKSYGGELCSYDDSKRFYSYRRDGETGRMASLIWIEKLRSTQHEQKCNEQK